MSSDKFETHLSILQLFGHVQNSCGTKAMKLRTPENIEKHKKNIFIDDVCNMSAKANN